MRRLARGSVLAVVVATAATGRAQTEPIPEPLPEPAPEPAPEPPPAPGPEPRPRTKVEPTDERSTDEAVSLYANAILYGIGSGIWFGVLTQPQSVLPALLPPIGFSGLTLATVALLDARPHRIRYGVAQSIVSGLYIGLEEGIVWSMWQTERAGSHWQDGTTATVVWGFSTVGLVTGGIVGALVPVTPGRASFVGSAALWSAALAGFGSGAVNPDFSTRKNSAWLAAGIGLNAGIVAGLLTAGPVSPSAARVRYLDLGAFGGGVTMTALYFGVASSHFEGRVASGAAAVGIAGGLVGAWLATSSMAPDYPRREASSGARGATPLIASFHPTFMPSPEGALFGVQGELR